MRACFYHGATSHVSWPKRCAFPQHGEFLNLGLSATLFCRSELAGETVFMSLQLHSTDTPRTRRSQRTVYRVMYKTHTIYRILQAAQTLVQPHICPTSSPLCELVGTSGLTSRLHRPTCLTLVAVGEHTRWLTSHFRVTSRSMSSA